MKKTILILFVLTIICAPLIAFAALTQKDFIGCSSYGCTYNIVWDGWKGYLTLGSDGKTGYLSQTLPTGGAKRYDVRYMVALNPQDSVEGMQGPGNQKASSLGHRIVFWVDFNNTPKNPKDDQRFDGYMMTSIKDAIAGVTWWNGIPFGFYAYNKTAPLI
ncbi:hypothetical protein [Acetomicrobium sp.]|uniref:hypothetical protein n=1 Tax=Acetomicrobium sp. TaxID=1872099 RepID=UPI002B25FB65|nr:hypothetical protein [Acetomicrobium sp.]